MSTRTPGFTAEAALSGTANKYTGHQQFLPMDSEVAPSQDLSLYRTNTSYSRVASRPRVVVAARRAREDGSQELRPECTEGIIELPGDPSGPLRLCEVTCCRRVRVCVGGGDDVPICFDGTQCSSRLYRPDPNGPCSGSFA